MAEAVAAETEGGAGRTKRLVYRHAVIIRVTHWINVLCLAILLMSGLQIFNAHPALYWGEASDFERPLLLIGADTLGELGPRAFPGWITIPSWQDLATGRVWHFFFAWLFVANGLIYLLYAFLAGHFSKDLLPRREQWRHIGQTFLDHLRLRFPRGEEATRYNIIQKLTYLLVVLVFLPVIVLTGLTMSPAVDAALPWLLDIFGGRQSARTIHFVIAWLLVLFVVVHVFMVLVSGFINNMRSMISGWYSIKPDRKPRDEA